MYIGPPTHLPSEARILYFIANMFSLQQVIIPRIADIHIQKTVPGPPAQIAVAIPTMLPVPRLAARAEERAAKGEIPPD